jgi:RNA polymerase sigma-70 factor (ECF subfamily)
MWPQALWPPPHADTAAAIATASKPVVPTCLIREVERFRSQDVLSRILRRTRLFTKFFEHPRYRIGRRDAEARFYSRPGILGLESGDPVEVEAEVLALFDECGAPLLRCVGAFGVSAHDTEDVVQDVFLSLFRHVQLGRPRTNLRGWLFGVAHNLALKHRLRTRKRHLTGEPMWPNSRTVREESRRPHVNVTPEQQLASRQRQQRLLAVFRALPERDRRCLSLRAEGLR